MIVSFYLDGLIDWLIDWLVFYANISNISAISRREQIILLNAYTYKILKNKTLNIMLYKTIGYVQIKETLKR
jgi:hypothetical protein